MLHQTADTLLLVQVILCCCWCNGWCKWCILHNLLHGMVLTWMNISRGQIEAGSGVAISNFALFFRWCRQEAVKIEMVLENCFLYVMRTC